MILKDQSLITCNVKFETYVSGNVVSRFVQVALLNLQAVGL